MYTQRPFEAEDAPFIIAAHSFDHARPFLSEAPTQAQVMEAMLTPGVVERLIVDESGERAGFWRASVHDGWLVELRLIVAAKPRRGVRRFALRAAKRYAFDEIEAHRLWLEVTASNAAARALYESEGFVHEGTYREGFRNADGSFEDLAHYGMLRSEYR